MYKQENSSSFFYVYTFHFKYKPMFALCSKKKVSLQTLRALGRETNGRMKAPAIRTLMHCFVAHSLSLILHLPILFLAFHIAGVTYILTYVVWQSMTVESVVSSFALKSGW